MRRYRHNLSHYRLLTGKMGQLYPAGLIEVLPGDEFRHATKVFIRVSPMAAPVMHEVSVRCDHFFVPHRLSYWQSQPGHPATWEDFITGGADGSVVDPLPDVASPAAAAKTVFDYYGVPPGTSVNVNVMPLRGYNLIYNHHYRDQDLVAERHLHENSVARIAWGKDYLTTARPWPQKGPETTLPLGTSAPVSSTGDGIPIFKTDYESAGGLTLVKKSGSQDAHISGINSDADRNVKWDATKLEADLSSASAVTVAALRNFLALQRFKEARARWGSRYSELIRQAFGTTPLDSRLQDPEWLGGGATNISFSEVLQTANDASDRSFGTGDLYGHGISLLTTPRYNVTFREHGYIHTLISVRPKAIYQDGIPRTWLRQDREDFYQHEFAHVGQQEVLNAEVYSASATPFGVFGWSDRYAEYRSEMSGVAGEFRSNYATPLDYWHMAREYGAEPALNASFVECNPTTRIYNEQTADHLWVTAQHRIQARRVVPRRAEPRIL